MALKKMDHDLQVETRDKNMRDNLTDSTDRLERVVKHLRNLIEFDQEGLATWEILTDVLSSLTQEANLVFQDIDAIREFAQEGVDIEVNRDEDGSEG
jgi:hypothetical protein